MQMKSEQRRLLMMRSISFTCRLAAMFFAFMFLLLLCGKELIQDEEAKVGDTRPFSRKVIPENNITATATATALPTSRTLLLQQQSPDDGGDANRIGTGCSRDDIVIYQGPTAPLPSGIPSYTVEILNSCASGSSIADIHVNCGWFSSARLVNPRVFRRLLYDDCLVNDGEPLGPGQTLSFQYANSFPYPFSVSYVACLLH